MLIFLYASGALVVMNFIQFNDSLKKSSKKSIAYEFEHFSTVAAEKSSAVNQAQFPVPFQRDKKGSGTRGYSF